MSDEEGFIRALQATPEDDAIRLIYADWLEDHDQGPRAELIRVQCTLAALPEEDSSRAALEKRSAELLARHGASWSEGLPGKVQWRRGFPEVFEVRVGEYLRNIAPLERLAPVQAIRLYEPGEDELEEDDTGLEDADFLLLTKCPLLERWTDLEIAPGFLGLYESPECFEALVASPYLTQLRRLSVRRNDCLGSTVCLVADPKFAHLTHLDIFDSDSTGGGPADEGIATIVTSPYMARLEYFDMGDCDVGDDGLCTLAGSPYMTRLKTLNAECSWFTGPGIRALWAPDSLPSLEFLDLSWSLQRHAALRPTEDPVTDLIDAPLLSRLRGLGMARGDLEDSDLMRLAARPDISSLRYLRIGDHSLSAAGVQALLSSPSLAQLSHLEWSGLKLTDEIASVLLAAPQLTRLTVSGNEQERPDEDTMSRLQDRLIVLFRWE
jgi:uncharacterized protein (TIGR02996 family)